MRGPQHGEERNRRLETRTFPGTGQFDAAAEGLSLSFPSSVTETVTERWCAACAIWVECRGLLGGFKFAVEHEHGREVK